MTIFRSSTAAGAFLVLLCLATNARSNDWIAEGDDNLWSNPENWSQGVAPLNATSDPAFGWDDAEGPFYPLTPDVSDDGPVFNNDAKLVADDATVLIDSSVAATAYGVRIGFEGASNTLEITGGTLQVGGVPANGGDVVGWHLDVGRGIDRSGNPDSLATLMMSGGDVETNGFLIPESFVDESLSDPYETIGVDGEVLMSGGTVTARWMNVGQFTGNGNVELSGDAVINLWPSVGSNRNNGGHFEMKRNWFIDGQPVATVSDAHLDIRDDAVINIFGTRNEFTMTPDEGEIERMQQYVSDEWLTANNGTAEPIFTLQECPDDGTYDEICLSGMMITITAPPVESMCSPDSQGDLDGNGRVEFADFLALSANFGNEVGSHAEGDIDCSGSVDFADFLVLSANFGTSVGAATSVPEPSGMALFACVGFAGYLRRRCR